MELSKLLDESLPPEDFPFEYGSVDIKRNYLIPISQFSKVQRDLKRALKENKKLHDQLSRLQEESSSYIEEYHNQTQSHSDELKKMKKYLLGSVRRVKYLVS